MQGFPYALETGIGRVSLRRAEPAQLPSVLLILDEAAAWLVSRGIGQWLPGSFSEVTFRERIKRREVYLLWRAEEAVGTLTLQWSDPFFWGEQPPDAGYVHALAVRRSFAGKGLGRALLACAERLAASEGKQYLRLDCMTENPGLRAYYESAGFVHQGDRVGSVWSASLYQKTVRVETPG